jgi:hypothetical protein
MWRHRFASLSLTMALLLSSHMIADAQVEVRPLQDQLGHHDQTIQQLARYVEESRLALGIGDIRAEDLIGQTVYLLDGRAIGDVSDLMVDEQGEVLGVVIGVGGFLAQRERHVVIGLGDLQITQDEYGELKILTTVTRHSLDQFHRDLYQHQIRQHLRQRQQLRDQSGPGRLNELFRQGRVQVQRRPSAAVRASRTFVGPHQYPPQEFAAYGIVAFPVRAVTTEAHDRFMNVCKAYWATLDPAAELFVPIEEQMVTVWPVTTNAVAEELNSSQETSSLICDKAIEQYHLSTARQAIRDARRTVESTAAGVLSGRGPFLLAWRPAAKKGDRNALVLGADLSRLSELDDFVQAFRQWSDDVESSTEFWPPLEETESVESYLDRIRTWADRWGPTLIFALGKGA